LIENAAKIIYVYATRTASKLSVDIRKEIYAGFI